MRQRLSFQWIVAVFLAAPATSATPLPAPSDPWDALIAQGSDAYNRGAYAESEKLYAQALVMAEGFGGQDDRLAASLSNLGTAYRAQGKYVEAEKLYRRALGLREAIFRSDHSQVAVVLNNLAPLYPVQGRYADAEPLFSRVL